MSHLRFGPPPSPVFPAHSDDGLLLWLPSILFFPRVVAFPVSDSAAADPFLARAPQWRSVRSPLLFLPLPLFLSFSFSAQWSEISKRVFDRARVAQRVMRMPDAEGEGSLSLLPRVFCLMTMLLSSPPSRIAEQQGVISASCTVEDGRSRLIVSSTPSLPPEAAVAAEMM